MGNLPIQDLIAFSDREEAARPISLKLLGPKTNIEGSYTNLVDGLDEFGEMIYIVARKDGEAIALEQFRFTQDNFIDALYLDARGKGKKAGASLITLSALGLDADDSLAQLKAAASWEERYEMLQQTDGYSGAVRAKKERLKAAQEAEEAVEGEAPAEGAAEESEATEEGKEKSAKLSDDKSKDKSTKTSEDKKNVESGDKGKSAIKEKES